MSRRSMGRAAHHVANLRRHLQVARRIRPAHRYLWRELIVRRPTLAAYQLRATQQRVHLRHRSQDIAGFEEVFIRRNYDFPPPIRRTLQHETPLRVVDLGANIGLFGLRVLADFPSAEVVAVEPDESNLKVLRRTVEMSGAKSWDVVAACAATTDGVVPFVGGKFMESRVEPGGVPTRAVDVLPLLSWAHFVKIDIEGAEDEILRDPRFADIGAAALYLEYHPPHPREHIVELLRASGYTVLPFTERLAGVGELWAWRESAQRPPD